MYIAGAKFTSLMDKTCIEKYKMPEIMLMENAAESAFNRILKIEKEINEEFKNITIVCASGNNGGDGFAISRKLYNIGKNIQILSIGKLSNMSSSAETNYKISKEMGIDFLRIEKEEKISEKEEIEKILYKSDLVLDCIFGAGLNRNIEGNYKELIEIINRVKEEVEYKLVAIDIPSGINGDTGQVMGVSIKADFTISFEFFKKGFLKYGVEKYTGKIYVEKIGVPYKFYNEVDELASFIDEDFVLDNLIIKEDYSHKGDFGKVAVFAGSNGLYGAAYLSTEACVKTGSGLTTLMCSEDLQKILAVKLNEAMTCLYSDSEKMDRIIEQADAIAFGPGIGNNEKSSKLLEEVLSKVKVPIVIDADGINVFEAKFIVNNNPCIMTPHLGEFSRLTGISIDEIEKDRIGYAQRYAKEKEVILVLKGKNTIVTDGIRTMVNTTGNYAMANGGMGDTLTGIITSLSAQGYDVFVAAAVGVYLHGKCGDSIFKNRQVVNASDIIKRIPKELKILYNRINK